MAHDQYGLWKGEIDLLSELGGFDMESQLESMTLKAELKDSFGGRSYAAILAVLQHSSKRKYLQLSTSTKHPKVGEYIILHIRSNYYLEKLRYVVFSKGAIVTAGQEQMEASLKTFPLALTQDMAGSATVIAFALERGEEVVADALTFPVDALTSKPIHVNIEEDSSPGMLKISVTGEPESTVSLAGSHLEVYELQKEQEFTRVRITKNMMEDSRSVPQEAGVEPWVSQEPLFQQWGSGSGFAGRAVWLPRGSFGTDSNHTFSSVGLHILSDGGIPARPHRCNKAKGLHSCLLGGCYSHVSACDGKWDCTDGIDESNCLRTYGGVTENLPHFHLYRNSRSFLHFAPSWLWKDVILGRNGRGSVSVRAPERPSNLVITAFALHPQKGISILEHPIKIKTVPSHWMWVEAPPRVGVWEQVGVRVTLVNCLQKDLPAIIVLTNNSKYKFVSVEEFQKTQTFLDPPETIPESNLVKRMVPGEHEHSIVIPGFQTRTIYLPIVPTVTGKVRVTVQASLPGTKLSKSTDIFVEDTGVLQEEHTSLLLDLSSRAYLFTFLDVVGPNSTAGDSGTLTNAEVSLFGGVVGTSLNDVVRATSSLDLPEIGCEPVVFSILMTMLKLNYWTETGQEPPKDEKQIFSHVSLLYQTAISFQSNDGGFKYFRTSSTSSVWVTSLALRALNEVSLKWPNLLYVDPQVTDRAIRFLLKQQSKNGAFWEPNGKIGVRTLEPPHNFGLNDMNTNGFNLSSTALTIIQLLSLKQLPEPLDEEVLAAISSGGFWLEQNLDLVAAASHPLEIALVALVLQILQSPKAEEAFGVLSRNARQEVKYVYWGEDLVPLPSYRVESQRPHLQPRRLHRHDSGNIAATACALRVYASRGELLTPAIVRWLHVQRAHEEGWMSTLDTLLAWEGLRDYALLEEPSKEMHLTVTIEMMKGKSRSRVFSTSAKTLRLQKHSFEGVRKGSIRVQGKGNGSAVLQLTSRYYVTNSNQLKRPPLEAFKIGTGVVSSGKNSSTLSFSSCVRWIYTAASATSGIAVLDINVPTGYGLVEKELQEYVLSKKVPFLKMAKFESKKVSFYFEKITSKDTCVEFSVDRWFPVANLTKNLLVRVYEYYSPELFATELLDMSSITLDICQVCGSYQCPNCPVLSFYSSSAIGAIINHKFFFSSLVSVSSYLFLYFYYR